MEAFLRMKKKAELALVWVLISVKNTPQKSGWVGKLSFGLSRTLVNSNKIDLIHPRTGITIGEKF